MLRRWLLVLALALAGPAAAHAQWSARLVGPSARAELRHPDPSIRAEAARRLGRWGEPHRAVAALVEALEAEEDLRVRAALLDALARRGDPAAVPRLAQRLGDLGYAERAATLRAIGAVGGESAIRVLVEWLSAPDVGDEAATALARIGAPAVPHLLRALRMASTSERAARVLGAIGDARATPALTGLVRSSVPATRVAAIDALGELGDERAAPAVAQALADPVPAVVDAALVALPRLGGPELALPLVDLVGAGAPSRRALALDALVRMSPEAAAPLLVPLLAGDAEPAVRAAALRALLSHPAEELVPALIAAARQGGARAEALDALARVPSGAGMDALVDLAREGDELAIATGLRRHGAELSGAVASRARARLGGDPIALALARDPRALPPLLAALDAPAPLDRARAAIGLALLGPLAHDARDPLAGALASEQDPRAFRAMARAASTIGARVDPARLDGQWWSAETAPEALLLAAESLDRAAPRTRRRARRAMRRALRAPDPRVRAGGALALARARDHRSWRALVAALEDEHDAVRLAAARALSSLAVRDASDAIAARERVEADAAVRDALRDALAPGRPPPAEIRGGEVLLVRVVTAPGLRERPAGEPIEVDVLVPDGRWLRTFTLPGGAVIVPDLPAGEAEVQVRI